MVDRERIRRIMEKHKLDVLIASAPENVTYLTEFKAALPPRINWLQRYWAVLPRDPDKEIVLVAPQGSLVQAVQTELPVDSIQTFGNYYYLIADKDALTAEEQALIALRDRTPNSSSPLEALLAAISGLGFQGQRVGLGVDEILITASEWGELRKALPEARMVEAYPIFREIRMVKTPAEIEGLRHAAQVNERALLGAMELVQEGVEQQVVHEKLRQGMVEGHGTPTAVTIGFSWRSNYSHTTPTDYKVKKGDLFKFDCGCNVNGFASDTARTGVLGQPTPEQQFHYDVLREAQRVGLETVKPGIRACDLFDDMLAVFHKAYKSTTFQRHNFGHGIGRSTYDAPNISPGDETVLEAGMVLNIEAPDHNLGFGGLTIEDTIILKEQGIEYLTHADRDLYIR